MPPPPPPKSYDLNDCDFFGFISSLVAKVVLWRGFWKIRFTWIYTVLPSVDSKHACEGKRGKGTATCFYFLVRKITIFHACLGIFNNYWNIVFYPYFYFHACLLIIHELLSYRSFGWL